MTDDELAELMRRADPARTLPDAMTEADLQANLAEIRHKAAHASRRRRAWAALPAVAALLLVLLVVQPWDVGAPRAHAATPPMLGMEPVSADVQQIVTEALGHLAAGSAGESMRRAEFEGWYLEIEEEGGAVATAVIAPQRQFVRWSADLSGRITVTSGEAYSPDGESQPPPQDATPSPGTVLSDDIFSIGEMPVLFATEPPSTAPEMQTYLEAGGATTASGTASYLEALKVLLSEWTLNSRQQAAVLQVLTSLDGVGIAGETTDRLGRASVALTFQSEGQASIRYLLLLGADSGQILALEQIYEGGLDEFDLLVPSVISYIAWL